MDESIIKTQDIVVSKTKRNKKDQYKIQCIIEMLDYVDNKFIDNIFINFFSTVNKLGGCKLRDTPENLIAYINNELSV